MGNRVYICGQKLRQVVVCPCLFCSDGTRAEVTHVSEEEEILGFKDICSFSADIDPVPLLFVGVHSQVFWSRLNCLVKESTLKYLVKESTLKYLVKDSTLMLLVYESTVNIQVFDERVPTQVFGVTIINLVLWCKLSLVVCLV